MKSTNLFLSASASVLLITLLSACSVFDSKPDLKRLYEVTGSNRFQNPVVIIHGAFGSRLRTIPDHHEIWPGRISSFFFGRHEALALPINEVSLEADFNGSEAYALFDHAAGVDFYGKILKVLNDAGGYTLAQPGRKRQAGEKLYYTLVYDWRNEIPINATLLGALIEQIRRDYERPDLKVDIVAHSLGALVARYYIRYGSEDVLDGDVFTPNYAHADTVRKVVLVGPPNFGSIFALQNFMMGWKLGVRTIPPEIFATWPGAFQVLPHPDRDWLVTMQGEISSRDLYDINLWREFEWSIFNPLFRARLAKNAHDPESAHQYIKTLERFFEKQLTRGRRFHRALSTPLQQSSVSYIVFGGDCQLTPARCLVENVNGKNIMRLHPREILNPVSGINYKKMMLEPGDGSVTKPSLLARNSLDPSLPGTSNDVFPLAYTMLLCEKHTKLTGNMSFQDNLLNILLLQETTMDRAGY